MVVQRRLGARQELDDALTKHQGREYQVHMAIELDLDRGSCRYSQ